MQISQPDFDIDIFPHIIMRCHGSILWMLYIMVCEYGWLWWIWFWGPCSQTPWSNIVFERVVVLFGQNSASVRHHEKVSSASKKARPQTMARISPVVDLWRSLVPIRYSIGHEQILRQAMVFWPLIPDTKHSRVLSKSGPFGIIIQLHRINPSHLVGL